MQTWFVIFTVFVAGCIGGLVNAVITGELQLPHIDPEARVYRPGWIGNVLVGGVAALIFWGLYGPMTGAIVIGSSGAQAAAEPTLRLSEVCGALLTGVGGGRVLTAELDRRFLQKETSALTQARDTLATAMKEITEEVKE